MQDVGTMSECRKASKSNIFVVVAVFVVWGQVALVKEYTNSAYIHTAIKSSPVQEDIHADKIHSIPL